MRSLNVPQQTIVTLSKRWQLRGRWKIMALCFFLLSYIIILINKIWYKSKTFICIFCIKLIHHDYFCVFSGTVQKYRFSAESTTKTVALEFPSSPFEVTFDTVSVSLSFVSLVTRLPFIQTIKTALFLYLKLYYVCVLIYFVYITLHCFASYKRIK